MNIIALLVGVSTAFVFIYTKEDTYRKGYYAGQEKLCKEVKGTWERTVCYGPKEYRPCEIVDEGVKYQFLARRD